MQAAYKTNATVKGIVKWLIALALLPANRIFEGFQLIKQEFAASLLEQSQEIQNGVARLYNYFAGYWLGEVGPEKFSVNGDDDRTNNTVENWNRWFNDRCGSTKNNYWDLCSKIQT